MSFLADKLFELKHLEWNRSNMSNKISSFSKDDYAREVAEQIISEIKICGLQHFFPWAVYVYYKCQDQKIDGPPKVFVEDPS